MLLLKVLKEGLEGLVLKDKKVLDNLNPSSESSLILVEFGNTKIFISH